MALPFIDAAALRGLLTPTVAVAALEDALRSGLDPELDSPRLFAPLDAGEFLLMPAQSARYAGIKVATVAPENPAQGHPKIQGTYLLLDKVTLTPLAAMDGAELTLIRTPAVAAKTSARAKPHVLLLLAGRTINRAATNAIARPPASVRTWAESNSNAREPVKIEPMTWKTKTASVILRAIAMRT